MMPCQEIIGGFQKDVAEKTAGKNHRVIVITNTEISCCKATKQEFGRRMK